MTPIQRVPTRMKKIIRFLISYLPFHKAYRLSIAAKSGETQVYPILLRIIVDNILHFRDALLV